jgi:DNA-binding transcriptional ArsR family regulator
LADNLKEEVVRLHAQLCSGLADPMRLLLIYALAENPKNVGELSKALDLPQPTVSRHLKILRDRNIVKATREGQAVYYSLTDRRILQALDLLRAMMADSLKDRAALVAESIEGL